MLRFSSGGPGWLTTILNPDPDDLWRFIIRLRKGAVVQYHLENGWHVGIFQKTGIHMEPPTEDEAEDFGTRWFEAIDGLRSPDRPFPAASAAGSRAPGTPTTVNIDREAVDVFQINMRI